MTWNIFAKPMFMRDFIGACDWLRDIFQKSEKPLPVPRIVKGIIAPLSLRDETSNMAAPTAQFRAGQAICVLLLRTKPGSDL